jgi:hypothetical protein
MQSLRTPAQPLRDARHRIVRLLIYRYIQLILLASEKKRDEEARRRRRK